MMSRIKIYKTDYSVLTTYNKEEQEEVVQLVYMYTVRWFSLCQYSMLQADALKKKDFANKKEAIEFAKRNTHKWMPKPIIIRTIVSKRQFREDVKTELVRIKQ